MSLDIAATYHMYIICLLLLPLQEQLARLQEVEICSVQLLVEKEVAHLASFQGQIEQEGKAGSDTRNLQNRMRTCRKRVQDLMATWVALHGLSDPTAALPDFDEAEVLVNNLPWQPTTTVGGITKQHLQLRLHRAECELSRCREEVVFLPHDALRAVLYYQHQISLLQEWLMVTGRAVGQHNVGILHLGWVFLQRIEEIKRKAIDIFKQCGWVADC
jgi:hypothetical protein